MTKRATSLLLAAFLLAACGGSAEPSIDMDGKAEVAKGDAKDAKGEVCTADCAGKKCGSDGCQGTCGTCGDGLECSDDGKCAAVTCKSSKDCPGALVCAQDLGECVACVGDEDCAEGLTCGADHECHETYDCTSDIDCKEHDMVCDKTAGQCVECLTGNECEDEEYCKDNYCLPVECLPGESYCEENVVVACFEDGSGWTTAETCGEGQYCEDAACHDYACTPDAIWCDGEVHKVCSEDGKSVKFEEDCTAKGQHCFNGACIDTVCEPLAKFCVDDFSYGLCAADGMEFTTYDCSADQYCEGGKCFPQVCPPGTVFCQDNVAATCGQKGSAVLNQVDCGEQFCVNGECISAECVEGSVKCNGDLLLECLDPLEGFENVSDCTESNFSCEEGVCVAVCGDGACAETESCESCELDCGECVVCGECGELEKCNTETGVCVADTVLVPEGTFWMGCSNPPMGPCLGDQLPAHEVYLSSYRIDLTEVTAEQFQACVGSGSCDEMAWYDCSNDVPGTNVGAPGREKHPANCMEFTDAEGYCAWAGKRLCTEGEWEKAARGGCELYDDCVNDTPPFPWGQGGPTCLEAQSGACWSSANETAPVGSFPQGQSPYGVLDMAGNVFEIVKDWYGSDYYCAGLSADVSSNSGWDACTEDDSPHESVLTDPTGPAEGEKRVLRGGGFSSESYNLVAYKRYPKSDSNIKNLGTHAGFRCCADP